MKKALALMFVALLLTGLAPNALAEGPTLKASGPGTWTIYDSEGQDAGTLASVSNEGAAVDAGGYSILPKGGQYLGIIRPNGDLQLSGRHPVISPSDARLYLDVLEAIKTLK